MQCFYLYNNDIHLITYGCTMKNIILALLLFHVSSAGASDKFEFVALGDTAYKDDHSAGYHKLIERINKIEPDFSIHVGDTMGYQLCSDDTFANITKSFQLFKNPLIYTPGDNEWTDCYKPGLSSYSNPIEFSDYRLERLDTLRKLYFSTDQSLGKKTLKVIRQSDIDKKYTEFKENSYWIYNDVLFATVHIVGSKDGLHPRLENLTKESIRRRGANNAWIMNLIKVANEKQVKAVVVAAHAELFESKKAHGSIADFSGTQVRGGPLGPYIGYVIALSNLTKQFSKPILYIHGDFHKFTIDRPLLIHGGNHEPKDLRNSNFTRLQVYGDPEDKAVMITVDPNSESVFSFTHVY